MSSHPPKVTFLSFPCDVNSLKAMPKKNGPRGVFESENEAFSQGRGCDARVGDITFGSMAYIQR